MEETKIESEKRPKVNDEAMWRAHISYAKEFLGSDSEYCRRNRLSHSVFRFYKKKLGETKPRAPKAKPFVRVEATETVFPTRAPTLPSPQWTAEFIAALLATTR